ncbi:MAG: hypothetical protein ACSHW2_09575 [Parasphingopyxis sp.]
MIGIGGAVLWVLFANSEPTQGDWQRGFDMAERQQLTDSADCELLDSRYAEGCRGYVEDGYGPIGERRTGPDAR